MDKRAKITVRVIPRAKRNGIAEIMEDGTIKIRVTAPPVEGKANRALINYLADILNVAKSKINIVQGESNRNKVIEVIGLDQMEILRKIQGD